ncbi:hypothetical protein LBMAG37_00720 [Anaerolineae bacterium]|nr:hypothetical protein EMGBS3_00910 [Anaerolineaceae bacterium]GBL38052.1 hypothetical protein EMGBD1_17390 [Anaerolineaceae bacterium]GDX66918.1 hypothetical protein LBMAG37_00720 [Anaerolineae bacterium]
MTDDQPPESPPPAQPTPSARAPRQPPDWLEGRALDKGAILRMAVFVVVQIGACWLWGYLTSS